MRVHRYLLQVGSEVSAPAGNVTRVEHTEGDTIEFWVAYAGSEPWARYYVAGTGHDIDPEATVVGSTDRQGGLVWHLVRLP